MSQNGWNIFFDKVPNKPFQSYTLAFNKESASITTLGTRTVIRIGSISAPGFSGQLEVTLYNGSPLMNIAAVIATNNDSTAILYDAGLVHKTIAWKKIGYSDVHEQLQSTTPSFNDKATALEVKYRTVVGENDHGSLAVFPAPHQYFYPLDEAFNLRFVWAGNQYRDVIDGYGIRNTSGVVW